MRDTKTAWLGLGWSMAVLVGCADAPSNDGECNLPAAPMFEITSAELQTDISNSACPTLDAAGLDAQLLTDEMCEQRVEDCSVVLNCEADSVAVNGKLYEKEGQLRGRIDARSPLVCVYFVTAEFL